MAPGTDPARPKPAPQTTIESARPAATANPPCPRQMHLAEEIMREDRDILRALAR
jgi:hypothetical protein